MSTRQQILFFILIFSCSLLTAHEPVVKKNKKDEVPKHHHIYFKPKLSVSFIDNRSVPGKTDGMYFKTDLDIVFNYKYIKTVHEFILDLNIKEGISLTPMYDGFVIASDLAKLEIQYNYMIKKWLGYYLKAGLETHFFPGYDYQSEDTQYVVNGVRKTPAKKYKLTASGVPLSLSQGTGFLARAVDNEFTRLEFNLGLAGREVFVGDSLKLNDDGATDERELTSMSDVYEAGGEFGARLKGELEDKKVGYDIKAKLFMPFYHKQRVEENLSWADVLQFEGSAKVDFNINKYVAFNYEFTVKRDFAVIEEWQITNGLYLSLFYELNEKM